MRRRSRGRREDPLSRVRRLLSLGWGLLCRRRWSPLRPLVEAARFRRRVLRLRPLLAELASAADGGSVELALLSRLVAAWGNPGFVADAGFLHHCCIRALETPGDLLDCGSGLSTLALAALGARRGSRVWSLEQDAAWYDEVRRVLAALRISNVTLWHAPLRTEEDFVWFDLADRRLPASFGVVACDGPAVMRAPWSPEEYASWRAGVVPVLRRLGVRYQWLVLDDAEDSRAPGLVSRWRREGLRVTEVSTPTGRLIEASPGE